MLATTLAALMAFVSTNIDDLFVLLFLCAQGRRARTVILGQYVGFSALVIVSLAVSAGALLLRREWVGFLGLAPFAIGIKGLLAMGGRDRQEPKPAEMAIGIGSIAAVTFANGGDNIAVYAPLFARRSGTELAITLGVFGLMLAVWCALAYRLVRLPGVSSALDRWGHWLAPFVLLVLGVYIFVGEGTAAHLLAGVHR
jgi:cadmium resistance protein CadD (predicted permease)